MLKLLDALKIRLQTEIELLGFVPLATKKEERRERGELPDDLDTLKLVVEKCTRCELSQTRKNTVFGEGKISPLVMFVGEAPGAEEDATGRPFVGQAGQLLTKMINAMGLAREDCYIGNVVKCRPPGNATPSFEQITACLPYLNKQITLVKPKVIVALGATACSALLGRRGAQVGTFRGRWHEYMGIPVLVTYHPAALLRTETLKKFAWQDLKMVIARLGLLPSKAK